MLQDFEERKKKISKRSPTAKKYFYLNGDLHFTLKINRPANALLAWKFKEERRVVYPLDLVRKNKQEAYTTREVLLMLNRKHYTTITYLIRDGIINDVEKARSIETGGVKGRKWSEDHVFSLRDYFATTHRGRPRNDNFTLPQALPTREELRALMSQDTVFYVKKSNGEFVPTFREADW